MTSETTNRATKAQAIATALRTAGCDADTAQALDDLGWQRAAVVAARLAGTEWTDASETTRRQVIRELAQDAPPVDVCDRPQDHREFFGGRVCDQCGWARKWHPVTGRVVTDRAVQSSGDTRDTERLALMTSVDEAIARTLNINPHDEDDGPDDYESWCDYHDIDPQAPGAHGRYQDWLDHNDLESLR